MPKGTVPIAITNYFDSFVGWGGFGNPQKTATGFCATYWQHSHNVARNVSFDVIYQPANTGQVHPPVTQTPGTAPTEEDIQRKAKTGEPFSGRNGSPARAVSGQYLQTLIDKLRDSPDVKVRGLEINGAEFLGEIVISNTIPFPLHLKNCSFPHRLVVRDARFDRSLAVEGAIFENGFEFDSTTLKEDLILDADISVAGNGKSQMADLMHDVHVDGRTEITAGEDISVSFLKTGDLHIVTIGEALLPHGEGFYACGSSARASASACRFRLGGVSTRSKLPRSP